MLIQNTIAVAAIAAAAIAAAPIPGKAGTLTTLYTFGGGTDGANPTGPVIYLNEHVYGTTATELVSSNVFKIDIATGSFKVVHAFKGGPDGQVAASGVIYNDGMLFGTTWFGGGGCTNNGGCGTVFSINVKSGEEAVLYSFSQGPVNGPVGAGRLVYQGGTLYGTTVFAGANDAGSFYSFDLGTRSFGTIYSFGGAGGINPNFQLLYENGLFYGTTMYGGKKSGCIRLGGCGVVFSIDPASGAESVIHAFMSGGGGKIPYYTNLAYHAGSFFSDTENGGNGACRHGCGVSYRIRATTGHETTVERFQSGADFYSGITIVDGNAYETLPSGGSGNYGELLEVNLKSGQKTVLYTFTGGSDGGDPEAPLTYHNGAFYGSTVSGGNDSCLDDHGCGTVFKFVP